MNIKLSQSALEPFLISRALTAQSIISNFPGEIPVFVKDEIIIFCGRNLIKISANGREIHDCCPYCLKAHLIKTFLEMGLNPEIINLIKTLKKIPAGHSGFYLDEGKLIKLFG